MSTRMVQQKSNPQLRVVPMRKLISSPGMGASPRTEDPIVCFSHLRWDFVFQRPQHLLSRFARDRSVLFWEEPLLAPGLAAPRLAVRTCAQSGVMVMTPHLPAEAPRAGDEAALRGLLDAAVHGLGPDLWRWYYTPMMLPFSRHLGGRCVVYDCMDALAQFKGAPPGLVELEASLFREADLVFTGGHSLYEANRDRHPSIHAFPSGVDAAHFAKALEPGEEPAD